MSGISKPEFEKQYPGEENIGVNYSTRLKNLKDIATIENYVQKDLNSLKQEITGSNTEAIKTNYENVKTQRQHARWINTHPEKWSNKSIMSKDLFINEARNLNITELQNINDPYQAVFILLQKLNYLDSTLNISKSTSRKESAEQEKFMALLKFQEKVLAYNTETAKQANAGTLTIDGIIGGGTLKSLLDTYKNKDNNTDIDNNEIIETDKDLQEKEQAEILANTETYKGFKLGDNNEELFLEGYGKVTVINAKNMKFENTLYGNSYDVLIEQKNSGLTGIRVNKIDPNNTSTRKYYKKENNLWTEDSSFKNDRIETEQNNMKTNIEIIDANIDTINNAKTNFETGMNGIDITNENNKSWRNYELSGDDFGDFEGKDLRRTKTLTTIGIKKLKFKEKIISNPTEISIAFNYSADSGFKIENGSYALKDLKTVINYRRDKDQEKLIITEGLSQSEQKQQKEKQKERERKEKERKEVIVPKILPLNKETMKKENVRLYIAPENNNNVSGGFSARFNSKDFIPANSDNGTATISYKGKNYIILDSRGTTYGNKSDLRALPVSRNRETQERSINTQAINEGFIYKSPKKDGETERFEEKNRKEEKESGKRNETIMAAKFHKVEGANIK